MARPSKPTDIPPDEQALARMMAREYQLSSSAAREAKGNQMDVENNRSANAIKQIQAQLAMRDRMAQDRQSADLDLRNRSTLMDQEANTRQAAARTQSRGGVGALNFDRNAQVAVNNKRLALEMAQLDAARKGVKGGGRGGSSGGGVSGMVDANLDAQLGAQKSMQAERIGSGERMQTERLGSGERSLAAQLANNLQMQKDRFSGQKDLNQQSADIDELRRRRALATALATFRSAKGNTLNRLNIDMGETAV